MTNQSLFLLRVHTIAIVLSIIKLMAFNCEKNEFSSDRPFQAQAILNEESF